jgi:hypothetical protein
MYELDLGRLCMANGLHEQILVSLWLLHRRASRQNEYLIWNEESLMKDFEYFCKSYLHSSLF